MAAWPEKKLYPPGVFKIRIKVFRSGLLLGRNLATKVFVNCIRARTDNTAKPMVAIMENASLLLYFRNTRKKNKRYRGAQV